MAPNPEEQAALEAHNKARARHGCPPLRWDDNLEKEALKWAQHLAQIGKMEHSSGDQRKNQGENLAWSWSSDTKVVPPLVKGVESWLNEEAKYHGEKIGQGNLADWGHYTQCVWKSTTHVGVAKAKDAKGGWYTVGRYSPPGNWDGQKPY